MSICYPSDTDWSLAYTDAELGEMRSDLRKARKMELAEARAWYSLAMLTAWRVGVCPVLVRPVPAGCMGGGSWLAATVGGGHTGALPVRSIGALNVTPYVTGGEWVNACGCQPSACGHGSLSEVILPGPIGEIEWVKIDGIIQEPTSYRVDDGNRLVSLDKLRPWPGSQDFRTGPDEPNSFAVSYYQGAAPNDLIRAAAGTLAIEFYRMDTKDKACRLPFKTTQVVRFGSTYDVAPGLFKDGLTSIAEVDLVIRMYNPNLLKQGSRIVTPENRSRGRRTTYGNW